MVQLLDRKSPRVKVQRNGNSKVLPVPADIARDLGVDLGATFTVEVAGDDVIYHRSKENEVTFHGAGEARYAVIPDSGVVTAPQRASTPALDWDF